MFIAEKSFVIVSCDEKPLAEKGFFLKEFYSKLLKNKMRTAFYLLCKMSKEYQLKIY